MQKENSLENFRLSKTFIVSSVIFICLSGLFLRVWNLDQTSLWVDEVIYAHTSQSWLDSHEMRLPSGQEYVRVPFYTISTAFIYQFFGEGEWQTRITSVIFGMLVCLGAYFLARKIFNEQVALLTLFFMVFSHFEIGWSRTARMYTMFQFFSLGIVYCLIEFLEPKNKHPLLAKKFFEKLNFNPVWFLPLLILFGLNYLYVHALTLFIAAGVFVYLAGMAVVNVLFVEGEKKWINKYSIFSILSVLLAIVSVLLSPKSISLISEFLHYTPPWAVGDVSAANKMVLFEFLISSYRFPMAIFFFIGCIQILTRWKIKGILIVVLFLVQLFLLSFIFTHRKPVYLFNVFPFFLMISSFGFLNILDYELEFIKKKIKDWLVVSHRIVSTTRLAQGILIVVFFSIFFFSPWLRVSLHIPFNEDGISNMAVTPAEWKEATKVLKRKMQPGDMVIASHPELSLYYGIKAQYTLNHTLLNQAKDFGLINKTNQYYDNYAGIPCIENLSQLKAIVAENKNGWILIESYGFPKEAYTPKSINEYIRSNLKGPIFTKNKTVMIFYWNENISN